MADYQQLYHLLFNHITDTINSLQMIQRQAESMYIDSPDPELTLLPGYTPNDDSGETAATDICPEP